jgi:hypothetical protein
LRVEEIDAEETDWKKRNEYEGEYNGHVCGDQIVLCHLGSTDGQTELPESAEHMAGCRLGTLTIQVLIPAPEIINNFLLPALSIRKNGIAQQSNLNVKSLAPRILDILCDNPIVVKSCSA